MAKQGKVVDGADAEGRVSVALPIKASGGVVLRRAEQGPEVLVVHRQRYDDWSLPQGKNEPDETPEHAARREVTEETGLAVRLITGLGDTTFNTGTSQKEVVWFAMKAMRPSAFVPNDEVDQIRWLPIDEAQDLLSYELDRRLVESVDADALLTTGTLFLVRHGSAGERQGWQDDDRLRPLSNKGERQAKGIATYLAGQDIESIMSSPFVRSVQTMMPLAEELGLEVIEHPSLAEGEGGKATRDLVRELAGTNAVLCSHGDVIPDLIDWMLRKGMTLRSDFECKKGSIWEIDVKAGVFRKARYIPPTD